MVHYGYTVTLTVTADCDREQWSNGIEQSSARKYNGKGIRLSWLTVKIRFGTSA